MVGSVTAHQSAARRRAHNEAGSSVFRSMHDCVALCLVAIALSGLPTARGSDAFGLVGVDGASAVGATQWQALPIAPPAPPAVPPLGLDYCAGIHLSTETRFTRAGTNAHAVHVKL